MDTQPLVDFINGNVPGILMIIAGLMAVLVVYMYRKDESTGYRLSVLVGVVLGVAVIAVSLTRTAWTGYDGILVLISGFALVVRPIKNLNISLILSLIIMGVVYLALGNLTGDLSVLASGWPRIIIAFVCGAFCYMLLHFAESIVMLFGKIFNCWPILAVLGILCIIEGVLMVSCSTSIFQTFIH